MSFSQISHYAKNISAPLATNEASDALHPLGLILDLDLVLA